MAHLRSFFPYLAAALVACSADHGDGADRAASDLLADLRADSNRDGTVRFDDDSDANKTEWNAKTGAIFLANIDDDERRCRSSGTDLTIALCNDASDEVVNGADDALDLARLKTRPWPRMPADAVARVFVATKEAKSRVRLFEKTGPGEADFTVIKPDTVFSSKKLQAGLELGIEAKDIVRDAETWDGYVDVQLEIGSSVGQATDKVRMRVAPVLTYHHLLPAEQVWVSSKDAAGVRSMRADLTKSCKKAGIAPPKVLSVGDDPWVQDVFEPAFMSMPGPNGAQHVMLVNYRSANVFDPDQKSTPLRPAGQVVWKLRGKDVAGVQQFDVTHDLAMDTLNSFGNLETVPPYEKDGVSYPLGRILRGKTKSFYPDQSFDAMIEAQGQQPEIDIDTSWLVVGHVDETISFVKAPTPRGWMVLVNDARLAKKMLEDAVTAGHGDEPMFVGKSWVDFNNGAERPAQITIERFLDDKLVMQASAEAAIEVDAQLAVLKEELGLTDDEIIPVPFLHTIYFGKSGAYQPGMVNGIYVSDTRFAAPDPHGPTIDGKDIFKTAFEAPLAKIGIDVDWVEDWDGYHVDLGEVHCGSNTRRTIPDARWWESGR